MKYLFILLLFPQLLFAKNLYYSEDFHVRYWCADGYIEYRNFDNTRTDCLTYTNAIEFDWAYKYQEAIGQSLHYSIQTGKKAGIVLIMRRPKDIKYWNRLNEVIDRYSLAIDVWRMEALKR